MLLTSVGLNLPILLCWMIVFYLSRFSRINRLRKQLWFILNLKRSKVFFSVLYLLCQETIFVHVYSMLEKKSTIHNHLLKNYLNPTICWIPLNNNKHLVLKVCIFILKLGLHEQTSNYLLKVFSLEIIRNYTISWTKNCLHSSSLILLFYCDFSCFVFLFTSSF